MRHPTVVKKLLAISDLRWSSARHTKYVRLLYRISKVAVIRWFVCSMISGDFWKLFNDRIPILVVL